MGKYSAAEWSRFGWDIFSADGKGGDAFSDLLAHWQPRFDPVLGAAASTHDSAGGGATATPDSTHATAASDGSPLAAASEAVSQAGVHLGMTVGFDFSEKTLGDHMGTSGFDPGVWHGALSGDSFLADVDKAIGHGLGADHSLFFTPTEGDFAGEAFLVVDRNGVAGFQAGEDQIFHLMPTVIADHLTLAPIDFFGTPIGG
ncbi:MAG: hypothetical protein ACJ8EB_13750 [Allosphingosinicella sp.]